MAVGDGAVYVSSGQGAIDNWTGADTWEPSSDGTDRLETGEGNGLVTRVDLETGELLSVPVGEVTQGLAVDENGVWVVDRNSGTLHLLDPVTLEDLDRLPVTGHSVYSASGAIWVLDPARDTVTRVRGS